jgi:hypothetical protein
LPWLNDTLATELMRPPTAPSFSVSGANDDTFAGFRLDPAPTARFRPVAIRKTNHGNDTDEVDAFLWLEGETAFSTSVEISQLTHCTGLSVTSCLCMNGRFAPESYIHGLVAK